MRIVQIAQRTQDWINWRRNGIGASDAPAILGKSPWLTPQELWEIKVGRREPPPINPYMQRGIEYEEEARRFFEECLSEAFTPICAEHDEAPFIRASFDGVSVDLTCALEIKVPGAKAHKMAMEGHIPPYYMPQLQHMFMLGIDKIFYASYSPETKTGVVLEVERDESMIEELWKEEHSFWSHVREERPLYSPEWEEAAVMWLAAEADYAAAKIAKEAAAQRLRSLLPEGKKTYSGAGVTASLWRRSTGVDWDAFVRHMGNQGVDIDLNAFRLPGPVDEQALLAHYRLERGALDAFRTYSDESFTVKAKR